MKTHGDDELLRDLRDEADLCANEGVPELAGLLNAAADRLETFFEQQPADAPPVLAELNCVCGAVWEWRNRDWELMESPQPAAQFAGSYGTIDESAARRIATALGWKPPFSWVGLTQQDIDIAFDDTQEGGGFDEFARAIEQRLKEKNT